MSATTLRTIPPSLSHFVIFNPTLKPQPTLKQEGVPSAPDSENEEDRKDTEGDKYEGKREEERDKDLEDDLKELAQILFYTSRLSKTVSRDTMLKQTGLIKGLMGFSDMIIPSSSSPPSSEVNEERPDYISIKSTKSRMIVWSPEPDFHFYLNITLSTVISEDGKREQAYNAQGFSDRVIVSALKRGYEDFRLLHGRLTDLLPPSGSLSTLLEKFFTRFAFEMENDIISAPISLDHALPLHLKPDTQLSQGIKRALEVWAEDSELEQGTQYGIINASGPIYTCLNDPAMLRFLSKIVTAGIPPPVTLKPDGKTTLGLGRRDHPKDRKQSWGMPASLGNWVPTLSSLTPRSLTPVPSSLHKGTSELGDSKRLHSDKQKHDEETAKETKGKWGFAMPSLGLGDTLGSVGGVFGLGNTARPTNLRGAVAPEVVSVTTVVTATDPLAPAKTSADGKCSVSETATRSQDAKDTDTGDSRAAEGTVPRLSAQMDRTTLTDTASIVSRTTVDVEELQSAVEVPEEVDLGWEKRNVYLPSPEEIWQVRRLNWIIRDNILLFIVHPAGSEAPFNLPCSRTTLALYSKVSSILSGDKVSVHSHESNKPSTLANSIIVASEQSKEIQGPELDSASSASLAGLHDFLHRDHSINEVYGRTGASRFIVSKRLSMSDGIQRNEPEQVHMLVGRKDASLTDADQAMRAFLRSRQVPT